MALWEMHQQDVPCPVCRRVHADQVNCRFCAGTGNLRYVGLAVEPWNEIVPGLWIGGHEYQPNPPMPSLWIGPNDLFLAQFDVVASLARFDRPPPPGVPHLELLVTDDEIRGLSKYEVLAIQEMALEVAQHVEAGRKVLVRCLAGLNRSSLVAALAMVQMGHQPQEAIDLIREKRSHFALFNQRFVEIILAQQARTESAS